MGRSYVRLDQRPTNDKGYSDWVRNLQKGQLYYGDGRSHFLEFTVDGRASGEDDLTLADPRPVDVRATVAARLEPDVTPEIQIMLEGIIPFWHLERARIGRTREVAVELVVNGVAVDKAHLVADGVPRLVQFKASIAQSSWVALRILPSGHTHPVFITLAKKPIRASRKSAQWCRACIDKVWGIKSPFMRDSERPAAAEAFDHARKTYDMIAGECEVS